MGHWGKKRELLAILVTLAPVTLATPLGPWIAAEGAREHPKLPKNTHQVEFYSK